MIRLIFTLLAGSLLSVSSVNAQLSEVYFSDHESKEGGEIMAGLKYGNDIIIGGQGFERLKYQPFLMRVDTAGNTVWNTGTADSTAYQDPDRAYVWKVIAGSDGFLYALCRDNQNHSIWKVHPATGQVHWRKMDLPAGLGYGPSSLLAEADSASLLFIYSQSYNSVTYEMRAVKISRATGDTIASSHFANLPWWKMEYTLASDRRGTIFFTHNDSVYKAPAGNPFNATWTKQYPSAGVGSFSAVYADSLTNAVFLIGQSASSSSGKILKIDPVNGTLISTYTTGYGDETFSAMVVKDSFMYVAWRHIYVGSGYYVFRATKYNRYTGSGVWDKHHYFSGGGGQGVMSLDADDSGNVYLTGYYNDANYGPENWGIVKFNRSGELAYAKRIAQDSSKKDDVSCGKLAVVINNQPYFAGELQTYNPVSSASRNLTFVRLSADSGTTLLQKTIGNSHQFPSSLLSIQRGPAGSTLALKQSGRQLVLEKYSPTRALLWTHTFSKKYYMEGGRMEISPAGDVYVFTALHRDSARSPYYHPGTDTMYLFRISSAGVRLNEWKFTVGVPNAFPLEMHADSANVLLIYQKANSMFARTLTGLSLGAESQLQISYNPLFTLTQNAINISHSHALMFGTKTGNARMVNYDKTTGASSNIVNIPDALYTINYVLPVDTSAVMLCGSTSSGRESSALYGIATKDTLWTRSFTATGQTIKCVTDPQKRFVYLAAQSNGRIAVRKVSLQNGTLMWTYIYPAALQSLPIDIAYDSARNQILVAGSQVIAGNHQVLILALNTLGNVVRTTIRNGTFAGNNFARVVSVLPDGSQWAGGNLTHAPERLAGFIFEIDTSFSPACSASSSVIHVSNCGTYAWNGKLYSSSGTYTDTISNAGGCDSSMTLHLSITQPTSSVQNVFSCDSYTWNSSVFTMSGTYNQKILNAAGCDSMMTLNLVIGKSSSSVRSITACGQFTWIGNTYTTSGTYRDTILNSAGCDSMMTLMLTINRADTSVTTGGNTLTANADSASYKWLDCMSGFSPVWGALSKTFTPAASGSYSVEITRKGCRDTSGCHVVAYTGEPDEERKPQFSVYPNPVGRMLFIESSASEATSFEVVDMHGRTVKSGMLAPVRDMIDLSEQAVGFYALRLTNGGLTVTKTISVTPR